MTRDHEQASAGEPSGRAFVGRKPELAELTTALDHALAGRGRLVLLVGEPGIGKTHLAGQLAVQAASRGVQVLRGRCWEGDGAPAYWPWVQIVRAAVEARDPERLRAEMGPGAADIAQVFPEVRERLPDVVYPPPLDGEQARFRLFDSITSFVKHAARVEPLLFILEDLHWADKDSLLLLRFLAREMAEFRLFVLGTYRDVEVQRGHPLAEILPALRREPVHERVLLRGLAESDVRALLVARGGADVPEALVRAIFRESEGDPFFIGEILRHLVEEGVISNERGRWTSRVAPEFAEAPEWADTGRAEKLRSEIEFLHDELSAAYGLGGRTRKVADTSDRARKAVTSRIRESIARITTEQPALGLHLENAIRTGVFCSYRPERSPDWNC